MVQVPKSMWGREENVLIHNGIGKCSSALFTEALCFVLFFNEAQTFFLYGFN